MKEIKYCSVCYETEVEDGDALCIDCKMQGEAELQEHYKDLETQNEIINAKFRGLTKQSHSWEYGDLIRDRNNKCFIHFYDCNGFECLYEVIAETVGQCINLRDDNNVEIYEDDFIRLYACKTENGMWAFDYTIKITDITKIPNDLAEADMFYVIGNTHQNPEMKERINEIQTNNGEIKENVSIHTSLHTMLDNEDKYAVENHFERKQKKSKKEVLNDWFGKDFTVVEILGKISKMCTSEIDELTMEYELAESDKPTEGVNP